MDGPWPVRPLWIRHWICINLNFKLYYFQFESLTQAYFKGRRLEIYDSLCYEEERCECVSNDVTQPALCNSLVHTLEYHVQCQTRDAIIQTCIQKHIHSQIGLYGWTCAKQNAHEQYNIINACRYKAYLFMQADIHAYMYICMHISRLICEHPRRPTIYQQ